MDVPTEFVVNGKTKVQARVRARHTNVENFQGQWRQVSFKGEDHDDGQPQATAEIHLYWRLARAIA